MDGGGDIVMKKVGSSPSKSIGDRSPQHEKTGNQQICDGFTVRAMMKNTVENIDLETNISSPSQFKDEEELIKQTSLSVTIPISIEFPEKKTLEGFKFCTYRRYAFCGLPETEKKLIDEDFVCEEHRVWNRIFMQATENNSIWNRNGSYFFCLAQVRGPPLAGAFKERPAKPTAFRKFYERGDFPIALEHDTKGNKIAWKVQVEELDYLHCLPLFFEGLCEMTFPYDFFARQGIHDMLEHGGNKVIPVIPRLITPIKNALSLRNRQVICITLKVLQHLVGTVGEALVPYYQQILPVLNIFKNMNVNSGDGIDYSQQKRENIGDLIQETLEAFERYGGETACRRIKLMIPTYQSCITY